MELGAEVNKIFGSEMAKLFAEKISEEELTTKASEIWNQLIKSTGSGYFREKPEIEKLVQKAILERMNEAIQKYLDQEDIQIDIDKRAKEIVEEIRKEAEKKIIDRASESLAIIYARNSEGFGLKGYICNTIEDVMRR